MHGLDLAAIYASVVASTEAKPGADMGRLMRRVVDSELRKLGLEFASERAFVCENLNHVEGEGLFWQCNLEVLRAKEHHIHDFPAISELVPHTGPALFIGATDSSRLTDPGNLEDVRQWFPQSQLEMIKGAGHFVHRTHPAPVLKMILAFAASCSFAVS
jgi:pimeloyl-ACP methyl ester carboxylesterase